MNSHSSSSPTEALDLVIVGGGPVGLACAIHAHRAGLRYLVIEKGCLVESVFRFPVNMGFFTTPELMEIGGYPLVCSREKPTRKEALDYYRSVARAEGLDVRTYEEVLSVTGELGDFRIATRGRRADYEYRARRVVLATGYYDTPNRLGIPGEDLPHVSHYYTEAHPYSGQRVVVVGGRNSACEAALDLWRHGALITLVHRGRELGDSVKYWVRPDVENRIEAGEIRALFSTEVLSIAEDHLMISTQGGPPQREPIDQVFLLVGYHPDTALLERCGLRPDPETLRVAVDPESLEALGRPGLHLAGSCSAGYATGTVFIENGRFDAGKIIEFATRQR